MTYTCHITGIKTWTAVKADKHGRVTLFVEPGWYRRLTSREGVISLLPMSGWKLFKHRLLWGMSGLVDAR